MRVSFDLLEKKDLVAACIKGNANAQRKLYDIYSSRMLGVCYRYAKSVEDARDIFQEGFLKVLENLDQLRDVNALEGWMKKIFVNEALKLYHKNKNLTYSGNFQFEWEDQSEDFSILEKIGTDEITRLIQRLPDKMRFAINLYIIEGYTHQEIADLLNISVGTSKSNLHDARRLLRTEILKNEKNKILEYHEKKSTR